MKGALYTLGALAIVGGGGWTVVSLLAAEMSDAPGQGGGSVTTGLVAFGAGVALCVAAYYVS